MTTQEALEAVFQKVVENARANCEVCLYEKRHPDSRRTGMPPHTCHATIEAAAEGMLAAALAGWNSNCDSAFAELNAEIDRLREEAKK